MTNVIKEEELHHGLAGGKRIVLGIVSRSQAEPCRRKACAGSWQIEYATHPGSPGIVSRSKLQGRGKFKL